MNQSFIATIMFAALAIAGTFLANLVVLVFTASQWHVSGVVLAIIAAGATYWAQHSFTQAGYYRAEFDLPATADRLQALGESMDRAEAFGVAFQYLAIALIAASVACFWLGMR